MKTSSGFFHVILAILVFAGLFSCEKNTEPGKGTAEFAVSIPGESDQLKSGNVLDSVIVTYQLIISIEDMQGNPVYTDKLIPIYQFGTGFISEKIEIRTGEFRLTKFMVINPSGVVIFATPVIGSPLAYLTKTPLPVSFNIYNNSVTQVTPEVLTVGNQTPDQFGYLTFGIQVIKPLTFWTAAVLENPMLERPSPMFTDAKLTVFAMDGWHYSFRLFAGLNRVTVRGGSDIYKFLLEKDGYIPQHFEFTAGQLRAATQDNPLYLNIPWDSVLYHVFELQPGPDAGKDAMISNLEPDKNFGDYKYFEATFLSEPILTVMRSNRSLIEFTMPETFKAIDIKKAILRLYYEVPVPFDSTYVVDMMPSAGIAWYGGVLQQVVEPWDEHKVTWNTQPKTVEYNQVYIPPFIRNVNFIDVDVTRLFVQPVTTDNVSYPNYGMLFRLWPTDRFPGFRFASSDYPNEIMRPKLTIYYTN